MTRIVAFQIWYMHLRYSHFDIQLNSKISIIMIISIPAVSKERTDRAQDMEV
jgi:hypothetical protein